MTGVQYSMRTTTRKRKSLSSSSNSSSTPRLSHKAVIFPLVGLFIIVFVYVNIITLHRHHLMKPSSNVHANDMPEQAMVHGILTKDKGKQVARVRRSQQPQFPLAKTADDALFGDDEINHNNSKNEQTPNDKKEEEEEKTENNQRSDIVNPALTTDDDGGKNQVIQADDDDNQENFVIHHPEQRHDETNKKKKQQPRDTLTDDSLFGDDAMPESALHVQHEKHGPRDGFLPKFKVVTDDEHLPAVGNKADDDDHEMEENVPTNVNR